MDQFNSKNYSIYANFLNKLARDLTKPDYKEFISDNEALINRIQL